jgi:hypothetical protein
MAKLIDTFVHHTIDKNGTVINTKTKCTKSQWLGANGYYHVDIQEFGKIKKYAVHRLLAIMFLPNPENKRTVNHIDGDKTNNSLSNLEWATDKENIQHAYDTGLQPYRREYLLETYESMLTNRFLQGESITDISKTCNNGLTQLSLHLREAAERLNLLEEYELELKNQKAIRAKLKGANSRNTITLQMLDTTTKELFKTFTSVTEAKEYLGKKSSGPISNVLAGRQKSAYGYFWVKI